MAGSVALNEGDCDSSGWLRGVLASVQLSEISDEWETERASLNMEAT